MARYCCSTSFPCECGARRDKHRTRCETCQAKADHDAWYAKPEVDWDGESPLGIWDGDTYLWDEDYIREYLEDRAEEDGITFEEAAECTWFTTCSPNNGRDFCMSEYLCDDLPEDSWLDDEEINKTVNDWIDKHSPFLGP